MITIKDDFGKNYVIKDLKKFKNIFWISIPKTERETIVFMKKMDTGLRLRIDFIKR